MTIKNVWIKISSKWRILLVIAISAIMLYALAALLLSDSGVVNNGRADLTEIDFDGSKLVSLDGQWELYWNKLLTFEEFHSGNTPQIDSFVKVPGVWSENNKTAYPRQGFATYRLVLSYPSTLKDPALRIQNVATAYKLFVNGRLIAEVGELSDSKADFKEGEETLILDLPNNTQVCELIFQVANLNYASGGLRVSPVFGSRQVLEYQKTLLLVLQLLFIGSVFIFGIHYFLLFLLQGKNKAALSFSLLCFVTVVRSLIWGETPLMIFFPDASFDLRMYINYLTGYNYVLILILFVHSIYPLEYKKRIAAPVLLPTLAFDGLLFIAGPAFMSAYTNYIYLLLLVQMLYVMGFLIKAVLRKRDNSVLMFISICVFILAINEDMLNYKGVSGINVPFMFLFGNFAVIMAMSFVQARQQALTHKKLISYNEKLLEADKLKDQIMATEMSFLQAQIKPHFLYNALSAIANVCEKDGRQAGKLIIDLAVYLRGSLEFNNLDKLTTIEKELEFVDTYFHIEQARFGQRIQLQKEIDIPLDVQIPVLILQPLVENAVRHGLSKKSEGGTVIVRMTQKEDTIDIEIEDDGVGISDEKRKTLLRGNDATKGVGLLNIHNRLLKLYGRGLSISSEPGQTCVKLSIPGVV